MELLFSNIPPVRLANRNILSCFEEILPATEDLKIASGYISTDALTELKKIIEMNKKPTLQLLIGMHHFDGITKPQYQAIKYLNDFLKDTSLGEVSISTQLKFHGKIYCFRKDDTPFAGIIGSSNLSSIFDNQNTYEADILLQDKIIIGEIDNFISLLIKQAGVPFEKWKVRKFVEDANRQMEDHQGVEKIDKEMLKNIISKRSSLVFKIPIKADEAPQSNLNAYFGKGRESPRGLIKPRHWYEVELIVPSVITQDKRYPKAGRPNGESVITVYTDDGWKFKCKISGENSKNFRSADDLKILGRWIKGRLENRGALKVGEAVTDKVLKDYGRDDFELIGTNDPSVWLLNFGV